MCENLHNIVLVEVKQSVRDLDSYQLFGLRNHACTCLDIQSEHNGIPVDTIIS